MSDLRRIDPWLALRQFTNARIALGRVGHGLPTHALLEFGVAHAQARDAVHQPLDTAALHAVLQADGFQTLQVCSAAGDRQHYLRRPDLGRRLSDASRAQLARVPASAADVVFVLADGLSAVAVQRHAPPLLAAMRALLADWRVGPVVVACQARVALGDEIGELLKASLLVVLIGERPGLSSSDSLGIYLTWQPAVGRTDAQRNCISNVRPEGLGYADAARKLHHLMIQARRLGISGVELKDESDGLIPLALDELPEQ